MPSWKYPVVFLSLLAITSLSLTSESAPTYSGRSCSNSTFFTANDTFESNLNSVLSSLSSNATRAGTGFYNASAGEDPTDVVYGLSLCRGDVSTAVCQDCVATATKEIRRRCPLDKVSIIWYDECFLRYSNEYIFGTLSTDPALYLINTGMIQEADRERFSQLLSGNTTNLLATRASNSQSGKKFATEEEEFNSYQTLYNLVQCTPDLTASDCYSCLQKAILPICCGGNQGGRALLPSCNLR
ncbi:hypothetical protein I3843_09G081400 [Carya illinoinensis]|uniref:Gnk2-homologous domain-containing protein n=1 Tax=Carya illinoinensis TaxID=32201 RepID=A0A8T1PK55_CARIL|nr:cysteine-rich receptor-like protein kinase 25 [Carya illinoinensis]KAG6641567.1 hypothetical protein CIPAW_09G082800 [Carya illinoinensis]KAG7962753.1 hypothetical protein I3843_09G081400 [Carya illinoinensis]